MCVKWKPLIGFGGLRGETAVSLYGEGLEHFVELNPVIRLAPLTFAVSAPGCKIHLNAKTPCSYINYNRNFYLITVSVKMISEQYFMCTGVEIGSGGDIYIKLVFFFLGACLTILCNLMF